MDSFAMGLFLWKIIMNKKAGTTLDQLLEYQGVN
jgi:hypothetical protein